MAAIEALTLVEDKSSPARRALRFAYRQMQRRTHAFRRWKAEREIVNAETGSVLFVCHGNVCRSPFAEHYFLAAAKRAGLRRVVARSAGFIGPGRGSPETAVAVAGARGISLEGHVSQLLDDTLLDAADVVVVMSGEQAAALRQRVRTNARVLVLGDLDPRPIDTRTILDPWSCDARVFDDCFARIERCVDRLVSLIGNQQLARAA